MRAARPTDTGFYNKETIAVSVLRTNRCKYVSGTKPTQFQLKSNDDLWNNVLSKPPELGGILKIENINSKRKSIPKKQIWRKFEYSLNKSESTDDYLVIPQPQHSVEVRWGDIENDIQLRQGLKNPNDPNKKYIDNIQQQLMEHDRIANNNKSSRTSLLIAKSRLLTTILSNTTEYWMNGGKAILLINEENGWTLEDEDKNDFNLSQIPQNYGMTAIIRKKFFKDEHENNNFHKGITGVQNFIGSPMMITCMHKEHGNMKFVTYSQPGSAVKLWICCKEKTKGIFAKFCKEKLKKKLDCCADVHHFEKEIFWEITSLLDNGDLDVSFTTQRAGDIIVGDRHVYHQVIHLGYTQATSIDYSPTTEIDWKELEDGVKMQQKYEENHLDGKCIQCPMSEQFGGDKFCSDLIKYGKLTIIESLAKGNKEIIINTNNNNNNVINDNNNESDNEENNGIDKDNHQSEDVVIGREQNTNHNCNDTIRNGKRKRANTNNQESIVSQPPNKKHKQNNNNNTDSVTVSTTAQEPLPPIDTQQHTIELPVGLEMPPYEALLAFVQKSAAKRKKKKKGKKDKKSKKTKVSSTSSSSSSSSKHSNRRRKKTKKSSSVLSSNTKNKNKSIRDYNETQQNHQSSTSSQSSASSHAKNTQRKQRIRRNHQSSASSQISNCKRKNKGNNNTNCKRNKKKRHRISSSVSVSSSLSKIYHVEFVPEGLKLKQGGEIFRRLRKNENGKYLYKCPFNQECEAIRGQNVYYHAQRHRDERHFQCGICARIMNGNDAAKRKKIKIWRFNTLKDLTQHHSAKHSPPLKCIHCGKYYSRVDSLRRHIKTFHNDDDDTEGDEEEDSDNNDIETGREMMDIDDNNCDADGEEEEEDDSCYDGDYILVDAQSSLSEETDEMKADLQFHIGDKEEEDDDNDDDDDLVLPSVIYRRKKQTTNSITPKKTPTWIRTSQVRSRRRRRTATSKGSVQVRRSSRIKAKNCNKDGYKSAGYMDLISNKNVNPGDMIKFRRTTSEQFQYGKIMFRKKKKGLIYETQVLLNDKTQKRINEINLDKCEWYECNGEISAKLEQQLKDVILEK